MLQKLYSGLHYLVGLLVLVSLAGCIEHANTHKPIGIVDPDPQTATAIFEQWRDANITATLQRRSSSASCPPPSEIPKYYWQQIASSLPLCSGSDHTKWSNCQGIWSSRTSAGCGIQRYIGEFKSGGRDGRGIYIDPDGNAKPGLWKRGSWIGTLPTQTYEAPPPDYTPPPPTADLISIDKAKSECEELGFEPKTEKFGECVLQLTR